jgi:hypothetical protein
LQRQQVVILGCSKAVWLQEAQAEVDMGPPSPHKQELPLLHSRFPAMCLSTLDYSAVERLGVVQSSVSR